MKNEKEIKSDDINLLQEIKKAKKLNNKGQIKGALQIVLELEKTDEIPNRESLSIKLLKADIYKRLGKYLEAVKITEELSQQFQKEEDLLSSYDNLLIQAHALINLGKLSKAETVVKQAEILLREIKETFIISLNERESFLARIKAIIFLSRGDQQQSLEFNKRAYEFAKDTDNLELKLFSLTNIGHIFFDLKMYDKGIWYTKEAIEVKYIPGMAFPLGTLIEFYIKEGKIEEAKVYYDYLTELREKLNIKISNDLYDIFSAQFLKTSLRCRKRMKAEDIFKKIAIDETASVDLRMQSIVNICDLLLVELRLTNDPEIIDEIQPYIQKLLELAEYERRLPLLAETYLLQAKLSLLTFDSKNAKRFLTQANQIAQRCGNKERTDRILKEQSDFFKKSDIWEQFKDTEAPMAERIKLARLHEQISELEEKRLIPTAPLKEDKVAIHQGKKICLVCRGEVLRFTYICECGAIYCDNCARAVTDLENVCWVCDVPIDTSKAVKPYDEKTEKKQVDKKQKKNYV